MPIDVFPSHMRRDEAKRRASLAYPPTVCERCDGTGNELLSMYRCCTACAGRGFVALRDLVESQDAHA